MRHPPEPRRRHGAGRGSVASLLVLLVGGGPGAVEPDLPDLHDGVKEVAERVERIRGVRFEAIPEIDRADDEKRRRAAVRRIGAAIPSDRLAARGRAWADLGLGDTDSPRLLYEKLALDLPGIVFDPLSRRVLVDPRRLRQSDFVPMEEGGEGGALLLATGVRPDEPVLAHALLHALDLDRTGRDHLRPTTDEVLAASAWVEGEASLVAVLFLFEGLGLGGQVVQANLDLGSVLGGVLLPAGIDRIPGVVGAFMQFVFREGFSETARAYSVGGWAGVDRACGTRSTTRGVLHREARSQPLAVSCSSDPPAGFVVVDSDSIGEEGIVALVALQTGKDNLGLMAGDGWVGDRVCRYEAPEGPPSRGYTEWSVLLATEEDAEELEYCLRRSLESRFGRHGISTAPPGALKVADGGSTYVVSRLGSRVEFRVVPEALEREKSPPARAEQPKDAKERQK